MLFIFVSDLSLSLVSEFSNWVCGEGGRVNECGEPGGNEIDKWNQKVKCFVCKFLSLGKASEIKSVNLQKE